MNIRRTTIQIAVTTALVAVAAVAEVSSTQKLERQVSIYLGGTLFIDNPAGDIDVIGTDRPNVLITGTRTVRAIDDAALREGHDLTRMIVGGSDSMRMLQTVAPGRSGRWTSIVNYTIHLPQTVHVKINSNWSNQIQVADMRGNVTVKNVTGTVILHRLTGPTLIDSANGNIIFNAPGRGLAAAQLGSINGNIEFRAPASSNFQWVGMSARGDVRTTFPARMTFERDGTKFRGSVNSPDGPTLTTNSLLGNILVLKSGTTGSAARSVRSLEQPAVTVPRAPTSAQSFKQEVVQGFQWSVSMGDIFIGQVRGNAKIFTGAGQVQLGTVFGQCDVTSLGGPLSLGDILGGLSARTQAGDILVQGARHGGTITTGGGTIRLLYNGGPARLQSGGGDIVVRQAAGAINADTQSGDITVTIDPTSTKEQVTAKTAKGNIVLYVPQNFAADVDATVITSDPESHRFVSDFTGLLVRREQIGATTKIHATGKINGGGERVELYAVDGVITISTHAPSPISVVTP